MLLTAVFPALFAALPLTIPSASAAPKPPAVVAPAPPAPAADWQQTLDRVVPGIVAIRLSSTRAFDTENAASAVATGFVVDAERGIILTNRHVVTPGPVVAEAVFLDHEEVPLKAIYRDPVHDFGFYQFDPSALKFMKVVALPLDPTHARVGVDLRVVGNDAGEKISILSGTLARLDRDAPDYGGDSFNDFNTFYYQAASSTSGGSSGSPVLDIHGDVIALNAGASRQAATSFYLPLDRVVRALDLVRKGQPVTRGTVQAVFDYTPYDEVRRLGVRPETEKAVRAAFPEGTGMLVVDETVPRGPADGKLEPGDVVVRVNGQLMTTFVPFESVLDDNVGKDVTLDVERGGTPLTVTLPIEDLHAITPAEYLEMGGGILNPLSFQQARNHSVPVAGVYLATNGQMFGNAGVPDEAVLTEVGGHPIASLDDAERSLASYADGVRVPVRFFSVADPHHEQLSVVTIDRRWFPMQRCHRDDATGLWPCKPSPAAPAAAPVAPRTTGVPDADRGPGRKLASSLVWIEDTVPYRIEGVYGDKFRGTGVIVDAEKGLVVVDRDTVPVSLGDVILRFNGALEVPAKVVWLHPLHDIAVIQYDPKAIGDTPVKSATFADETPAVGEKTWLVGLDGHQEVVAGKTTITAYDPLLLPLPSPPFFRESNLRVLSVADPGTAVGGVLADKHGRVEALWASFVADDGKQPQGFFRGMPADIVREVVEPLRAGQLPALRALGAELTPVQLSFARDLGLSEEGVAKLVEHQKKGRQALGVARLVAGTPGAEKLRVGDLILAVNGKTVTEFREVEEAANAPSVTVRVLREGKEQDVELPTFALDGRGTDRVVLWAGALLHEPHLALAAQRDVAPEGVYVAWSWYGAPAPRYGLAPTTRIVAVDGKPVKDLDAFVAAVSGRPDGGAVRLKLVDLDGRPKVITLKLDLNYWPTSELVRVDGTWERKPLP